MSAVLALDGCYDAGRAAALSGVPKSTVYDWARKEIVVPSISPDREKLWSFADLMALRIISWLRHPKTAEGERRPGAAMRQVKAALAQLDENGLDLWDGSKSDSPLVVDRTGSILIVRDRSTFELGCQVRIPEFLDLLAPFPAADGGVGPDLRHPREHLRIVPGKCAGEPHLEGSRLTTLSIAALANRGYELDDLLRLYPDESCVSLAEAIDLERTLGTLDLAA